MPVDAMSQRQQPLAGSARHAGEGGELLLYWRSIYKHKWSIAGLAASIAVLAQVIVSFMTPVYRSTVTLMIEQNKAKLVSIEEVYSGISSNREYFQTQAEILKSRTLAARVVAKLDLVNHPEFDPRRQEPAVWQQMLRQLGIGAENAAADAQWTQSALQSAVLGKFMGRLSVEPVRVSQLIKVSFESADRDTAARIANAVADSYIESDMESRYQMTRRASDWLNDRVADLKKSLLQSERALQDYRDRERIVDAKGVAQSGAARPVEDLTRNLVEARQKRIEAEIAYNQIKNARDKLESIPAIMRDSTVARLKGLENEAEKRVAELSKRYGGEHARMIQAEAELKQARESVRRQMETVVLSVNKEYEVARANEQAIERTLADAKNYVQGINRKEFQLSALERDVATNRQIYEMFMNRFKETNAASDVKNNVIAHVIDPAIPAVGPVKPNKRRIVMNALIFGILLGIGGALLLERLDNTVKSAEDVEEKLGQPMLAMLPLLTGKKARGVGRHYLDEPQSVFSEAIRTARTSVLLSAIDAPKKTLLVTSSIPSEGKTTFAINLALAHAQTKKVLLINADMRRPSIAEQLDLDTAKPGLSSVVSGTSNLADCVQAVGGSSLHIITSGPIPPNPLELLLSQRFKEVLRVCNGAYDIIILDSPPVQLVSDAVVLSTMATGVLFVMKADSTPYQLARRCTRTLSAAGATLFGVVLNQLEFKKADHYYGAYTSYAKYKHKHDAGYRGTST